MSNISLHGLGFIQVQLPAQRRMHVWHPSLPRYAQIDDMMHNHSFDFESQVLVGALNNWSYSLDGATELDEAAESFNCYSHGGERDANGNRPWNRFHRSVITGTRCQQVRAGEMYRMDHSVVHKTEPLNGGKVATLMWKTLEDRATSMSLLRANLDPHPDVDFDRKQLSDEALWEFVLDVLGAARGTSVVPF